MNSNDFIYEDIVRELMESFIVLSKAFQINEGVYENKKFLKENFKPLFAAINNFKEKLTNNISTDNNLNSLDLNIKNKIISLLNLIEPFIEKEFINEELLQEFAQKVNFFLLALKIVNKLGESYERDFYFFIFIALFKDSDITRKNVGYFISKNPPEFYPLEEKKLKVKIKEEESEFTVEKFKEYLHTPFYKSIVQEIYLEIYNKKIELDDIDKKIDYVLNKIKFYYMTNSNKYVRSLPNGNIYLLLLDNKDGLIDNVKQAALLQSNIQSEICKVMLLYDGLDPYKVKYEKGGMTFYDLSEYFALVSLGLKPSFKDYQDEF